MVYPLLQQAQSIRAERKREEQRQAQLLAECLQLALNCCQELNAYFRKLLEQFSGVNGLRFQDYGATSPPWLFSNGSPVLIALTVGHAASRVVFRVGAASPKLEANGYPNGYYAVTVGWGEPSELIEFSDVDGEVRPTDAFLTRLAEYLADYV